MAEDATEYDPSSSAEETSRRRFLQSTAIAGAAALGSGLVVTGPAAARGKADPAQPPNIILILSDQQRADMCARENFGVDTTPTADQLGWDGTWFNRAYTTSPLCSPARTSLLTGRYPSAHGVRENPGVRDAVFAADLPGVLREAGYTTALIGKNHTYLTPEDVDYFREYGHTGALHDDTTPEQREFDDWLLNLRHDTYLSPTPFPLEMQNPYRIVSDAIEWLDSLTGGPFFLCISLPEPHNPYQVPEPYFSMFPPEELPPTRHDAEVLDGLPYSWEYLHALGEAGDPDYTASIPRARSNYCGMMRLIDDQIARLLGHLEETGARDRTLLMLTADHGDFGGEYGLVRKGAEVPELTTRVPLIVNGPGVDRHRGPHPAHVSLADVFPTLCELIGKPMPKGVQGRSLWPMLQGEDYPTEEFASAYVEQGVGGLPYEPEDVPDPWPGLNLPWSNFDELNAVTQSGQRRMVRRGNYKVVVDGVRGTRLYHLPSDPGELRDLSRSPKHAEAYADMMRELVTWMLRTEDPLPIPAKAYVRKTDPRNYLAPYRPKP